MAQGLQSEDSSSSELQSGLLKTLLVIIPCILLLIYLFDNYQRITESCLRNLDRELISLSVEMAKRGQALTGAFSHAGFRHPGPLLFYYLAFFELIFPFDLAAHSIYRIASLVFHCVMFALSLLLLERLSGRGLLLPLLLAATYLVSYYPNVSLFADFWNPNFNISLAILFLVACLGTIEGRAWGFSLCALTGLFLVQNHVGAAPVVAVLGVVSVVWALVCVGRGAKFVLWYYLLGFGIALVVLLPLLLNAFTSHDFGNLGNIAERFFEQRESRSWGRAFGLVKTFFRRPFDARLGLPAGSGLVLFSVILLAPLLFWRFLQTVERRLYILCVLGTVTTVYALLQVFVPLRHYLVSYYYGVAACLIYLSLLSSLQFLIFLLSCCRLHISQSRQGLVGLALSVTLLAVFWPTAVNVQECKEGRGPQKYIESLVPEQDKLYHLVLENQGAYSFVASFALQMLRKGFEICVDSEWGYLYGYELDCGRRPSPESQELVRVSFRREKEKGNESSENFFRAGRVSMSWEEPMASTEIDKVHSSRNHSDGLE